MADGQLVERTAEVETAASALERGQLGKGSLLLVEGPAGIGKSALLREIGDAAEGYRVLTARGSELERSFPFGVVRQLFERALARDRGLADEALAGGAAAARAIVTGEAPDAEAPPAQALQHALSWLASNLADDQPLLIAIDDLQWADPASLGWVEHFARRVDELNCVLACGWRTGEPGTDEDALDRLRDEPAAIALRPAPLSASGVAAIVRTHLAGADDRVCDACARSSGGNPFLLSELVRTLITIPGVREGDVSMVRPESVGRSVGRRLGRLPESVQRAAEAAAVLGDGCELRHVAALAGLSNEEAAEAVDALVASDVLEPGRPLRFVHPLVQQVLHERVGVGARGEAHRRAAQILDAEGSEPALVAAHLMHAAPAADPWAVDRLVTAAGDAELRGAPAEAIDLLGRALEEPPAPGERSAILLQLGSLEVRMLRFEGNDHLLEVVRSADDVIQRAQAASELAGLSPIGVTLGILEVAADLRREVLSVDRDLALRLAASELANRIVLDPNVETAAAEIAELVPSGTPASQAERMLLATWSWWVSATGQASGSHCADLAEQAMDGGKLMRTRVLSPAVGQALLLLLVFDRVDASGEALRAALDHARRTGDLSAFALVSVCGGFRGWLLGDLREAEAQGRSAEAIASGVPLLGLGVYAYLSRTLIDRGALDEAETMLVQRMPKGDQPSLFLMPATLSLAMLRAAQGRWEEAAEVALSVGRRQALHGGVHPAIPWRIEAATALAALNRRDEAARLLEEQRPFTDRWNMPRHTAQLLRARGHVATGAESLTLLRSAAEQFAKSPARLEEARTRLELGAALRRANSRTEAREELRLALDLADRCGAWRLTELAREELAASGARPQRERLDGVDSLTGSELRVARMAAEGLSNPEIAQALFVSRKTVETHLGSVYRKLDVNRREALADALSPVSS